MNNQPFLSQNNARYKNARASLMAIIVASFLNLFLYFANVYLLFSAYLPLLIVSLGDLIAAELEINAVRFVFAAIALITILPYLLCWIFSKKRVGWMIAALAFFGIDSLFFLIDFVASLQEGDFSMIVGLVFRIWAISCLISGVIYGLRMKKETKSDIASAPDGISATNVDAFFGATGSAQDIENSRQLTVSRAKAFYGCAMTIDIYINRNLVGQLKNGETKSFSVPASQFELGASMSSGMCTGSVTVPYGDSSIRYQMRIKAHALTSEIEIQPTNPYEQ